MTWRVPNPQSLFEAARIAFGDLAKYLDRRQPRMYYVNPNFDYTVTTTLTDITNMTVTIDAGPKGATIVYTADWQVAQSAAGGIYVIADTLVDGVKLAGQEAACYTDAFSGEHCAMSRTGTQHVGPGTHVVKCRAQKSAAAGSVAIQSVAASRTCLTVVVYPD